MVTRSVSTRRALRKIPALRHLSGPELERLLDQATYTLYNSGEVLWRTHAHFDFSGIIQSGEIEVEYRINGNLVRSIRLRAGDVIPLRSWQSRKPDMIILIRAVTNVRLCLIPDAQINYLPPKSRMQSYPDRHMRWVWPALLILLILSLGQTDIRRITSGLLYMISNREHLNASEDPDSMNLLELSRQVDPGAAFVYNEEGYKLFQQARLPEAEIAFAQAIQADQTSAPALNNMAVMYFTAQNMHQATVNLKKAVEQDPNNAIARYNLGILLMQQNEKTSAIREFRQAGFIDPTAAAPHLQQAVLYIQLGDYISAEQRARTAIQLDPSQPSTHLLLAIALYNQGRDTEALTSIADSLRLEPGNRVASFYQALLLERIGQFDAALPILESLLATSTDGQEAARITVEIEAVHRSLSELEVVAP